jgi:hypothetical protein
MQALIAGKPILLAQYAETLYADALQAQMLVTSRDVLEVVALEVGKLGVHAVLRGGRPLYPPSLKKSLSATHANQLP